ncbi:1-acyl-sn-glycerol-3-phosphate acyltransferase beta-like [Wyeomyia smithii]|uniref:1-acyl-sn-glycerol-3-phosphate acyltransferase beta-like n=1 Tax=Wyeomyia smithii TaxID=174621 RepID=UPI002467FC56|nr:1-acyl-sn-glycerol-3-phosphate acyltransferase beta-like [Wyeomyia smithii]
MTDCTLCQYVGSFVRYYAYAWLIGIAVWFLLILATKVGSDGNKFKYYAKYGMIYFATQAFATLLTPISLLRPRNPINARIIATTVAHASTLLPITWELRNARILKETKGAVVMANHQSSMDILGMMVLWGTMRDVISIAKKEMLFIIPFGPAVWLAGVTFINRKNRSSAMKTLDGCKQKMIKKGYKMYLYPEGTRYPERGMLPFKKGGFHTAIQAGVPIVPVVFSHMYFIDAKKYIFKPGHVLINVLEPIPTAGVTKDNLDDLIKRTRDAMLSEYEKLSAEMDANLVDPKWLRTERSRFSIDDGKKSG